MRNVEGFFALLLMFLVIAVLIGTGMYSAAERIPSNIKPGDSIVVLTGNTLIQDGRPCQENFKAFVSPTGPNKETPWYQAERILFPVNKMIAVITPEGKLSWQPLSHILKLPVTPEQLVCSATISE